MEWISVNDKLPQDGETVYGFWQNPLSTHQIDGRNYGSATFNNLNWHNPVDRYDDYCAPSHWMPLPPPPKDIER